MHNETVGPVKLRHLLACALPLALCACGIDDWANAHMPVIGQRCEHWQCFTESGEEQSEINHQERLKEEAAAGGSAGGTGAHGSVPAENPGAAAQPAPAPVVTAPAAPATPPASPMPEEGAYKYVPRAPSAPGTTPFDGAIPPSP